MIIDQGKCSYVIFKNKSWIDIARETSDFLKAHSKDIIHINYEGINAEGEVTQNFLNIVEYQTSIFYRTNGTPVVQPTLTFKTSTGVPVTVPIETFSVTSDTKEKI